MVLYEKENPSGESIGRIVESDLREGPDLVVLVTTYLKVPGARRLTRELCHAAKALGGKRFGLTGLSFAKDLLILVDYDEYIFFF